MNNYHIVLVHPEIPQNTGNVGRLCVSTNTRLHLIEPLGYSLDDKYLRRSGMDYWQYLELSVYRNWEDFKARNPQAELYFFSTRATKVFWECPYADDSFLVFGNEGSGLPVEFYDIYRERLYLLPMAGKFHRSLNLANSAAAALFEGLRRNYGKKF
ncbi:MAG: tRNA (cytidine(34)-2'-O)-methyltransferase [Victivallaceae bacterium]|nr:tRNA (cytidine(34)-2'-O)-methyltransferase [Victivallaceae bacterium]